MGSNDEPSIIELLEQEHRLFPASSSGPLVLDIGYGGSNVEANIEPLVPVPLKLNLGRALDWVKHLGRRSHEQDHEQV